MNYLIQLCRSEPVAFPVLLSLAVLLIVFVFVLLFKGNEPEPKVLCDRKLP